MDKKIILYIVSLFLLIYPVTASLTSLGTYQQNNCVDLIQLCGTCSYNNVTSVIYPNMTKNIIDTLMTERGTEYNYTFCITDSLGTYLVNGVGDKDGIETVWAYEFTITENGKPEPSSFTIIAFIIFFIVISGVMILTMFLNLGHLVHKDLDLLDVAYSMLGYSALFTFYYFSSIYFPKKVVLDLTLDLLWATGFTHVLLPPITLIILMVFKWRQLDKL